MTPHKVCNHGPADAFFTEDAMKLQENPTKQQEIDYFRAWVNALPDSYLRSMFLGAPDQVEQMIRNDFAFDPIPELRRKQADAQQDLRDLEERQKKAMQTLKDTEQKARDAQREEARAKEATETIKKQARQILGIYS